MHTSAENPAPLTINAACMLLVSLQRHGCKSIYICACVCACMCQRERQRQIFLAIGRKSLACLCLRLRSSLLPPSFTGEPHRTAHTACVLYMQINSKAAWSALKLKWGQFGLFEVSLYEELVHSAQITTYSKQRLLTRLQPGEAGRSPSMDAKQCTDVDGGSNKADFSHLSLLIKNKTTRCLGVQAYAVFGIFLPPYIAVTQLFPTGNSSVYVDLCSCQTSLPKKCNFTSQNMEVAGPTLHDMHA